jgi:hypothetical protein
MQVRVADAAVGDVDLHVMRTWGAALDVHRFEGFVARMGTVGFCRHGGLRCLRVWTILNAIPVEKIAHIGWFLA